MVLHRLWIDSLYRLPTHERLFNMQSSISVDWVKSLTANATASVLSVKWVLDNILC